MMGGVSPETCWAIKKHCNNKFYYTVASCWFFLWYLYYDARIQEHQVNNSNWKLLCYKQYVKQEFFYHKSHSVEIPEYVHRKGRSRMQCMENQGELLVHETSLFLLQTVLLYLLKEWFIWTVLRTYKFYVW